MGLVPEFVRAGSWVPDPAFGCMWPWGVLAGTDLVLFVSSMAPGIFLTFRDSRVKRARQRLEVERTANLESGPGAEEKLIPLLTVSKDLGEIREQEEQRDEMLYQQAAALQQAKKEEQAEKKRKAEEEGLSLPIEMLAFKASLQKTQQSMMESLLKNQTVLAALEQECEKITLGEDDGLKQEGKEKLDEVKKRLNERAVLAWQQQGNKAMEENQNSAEALHRLRTKMAEDIKEYHTKGTEVSNVKQALNSLRKWMASSKKAINDREKAALKTKASKAIASGGNSGPLAMLSESLAVSLKDLSTCGQVDYSFSETGVVKKMMPVLMDST